MHGAALGVATLRLSDAYSLQTGQYIGSFETDSNQRSIAYVSPRIAFVHDNALFSYVGPFAGSRARFGISPSFGGERFTNYVADYRRYLFARPFTLAFRTLLYGNTGRDSRLFPIFLGTTELVRGYTSGSLLKHECATTPTLPTGYTGCSALDQLIGANIAVANIELRFPLTRSLVLGFLPIGFPPIEAALFYDAGVAYDHRRDVKLNRDPNNSGIRSVMRSYGASIRVNMLGFLILRFDVAKPLNRTYQKAYWTVSLGPTF